MRSSCHSEANAAPEWQAGSLRWRSRELSVACPLEGLVSRAQWQVPRAVATFAAVAASRMLEYNRKSIVNMKIQNRLMHIDSSAHFVCHG
jgi:hypothetical protein